MITQFFKKQVFLYKRKKAIAKAQELQALDGKRYLVLNIGGRPTVVSKQRLKQLIAQGQFAKGVTIDTLENKALFITNFTKPCS